MIIMITLGSICVRLWQMKRLTLIIINQTYYENSDWSRVSSQYTIECEVDMIIQYLQRLLSWMSSLRDCLKYV